MAWEKRSKHKYYYCKIRQGDRVTSHYLGNDIHAYIYSAHHYKHKKQSLKEQARLASEEAYDKEMAKNHRLILAIAEASLLINGYHLHKGDWRKAHEQKR